MAKISSQSYPSTNKIPMSGGTFHVTSSNLITTAFNDRFQTSYSPSIWTKTTTGDVVFNESSSPFSVAATAPAEGLGTYKLLHSKQILANGSYAIRHSMRLDFNPLEFSSKYAYIKFFDGSRSISISLVYTPEVGYQIEIKRVNSPTGTHTYYYQHSSNILDVLVVCDNRHFHFYKNGQNGFELLDHSDHPQHLAHNANYNVEIGFTFDSQDLSQNQAIYTPAIFDIVPCITGLPLIDGSKVLPATHYYESFASFMADPGVPGEFAVSVSGVGTYIGSIEDIGEISVLDVRNRETETSLVVSPVKSFYTDAEPILTCPEFASEHPLNGGSVAVAVSCFCDGTTEDQTPLEIVFQKGGNALSLTSNDLPGFVFKSEEKTYGMNFAYETLPYNSNFNFFGYRVHSFRSLPLKSGKKLYYGALVSDATSQDSPGSPEFTVRVTWERIDSTIAQTNVARLHRQYNESLEFVGFLLASDPEDPIPDSVTFSAQFGFYRIYSTGLRILSVEIKRTGAADSEYKVISQMHWAVQASACEFSQTDLYNCLHFEVKDPVGRLFYVMHDPCANTYTSGIASSASMLLLTDSYAAVETYDGRVAIFYQEYITRLYDAPGTYSTAKILTPDNIAFRTISQSDNGFLETSRGLLKSEEFYGLHCFDISTDSSNNMTIVFNRERLLDRSNHHNQSYNAESNVIEEAFYTANKAVEGVKDSPYLEGGFRVMTVPMSDINFDDLVGFGPVNLISQSSTLINLVTLRELLKVSSFDQGVKLTEPHSISTRAEAGYLKLNYDNIRREFLLSCIENRRRIPIIMFGKGINWKEIAIPAIKSLDAGQRSVLFSSEVVGSDNLLRGESGEPKPVCFSCYNVSSDFSIDGNIHCFVNQYNKPVEDPTSVNDDVLSSAKDEGCYLVISPEILNASRKLLIERDENGNYKPGKIFIPSQRQFRFNIMHSYGDSIRWVSSIKRDMQYMVNTLGGNLKYAMIRVANVPSERPLVESDLEFLSPFSRNAMFDVPIPVGILPYYKMPNTADPYSGTYEIVRTLEEVAGIPYEKVRDGARFRARLSYETNDYSIVRNNYIVKMKAICVQQRGDGNDKFIDACIRVSSHTVKFIVNDESTPLTVFESQLDTTKLHEFFIYVKNTQVVFRVDEIVGSSGSYDYRRKNVLFYQSAGSIQEAPSKTSSFRIVQQGGAFANSFYKVYETSWAPTVFDVDTAIYGDPSATRSASIRSTGRKDLLLKSDDLFFTIVYPVKTIGSTKISDVYHWPNGFKFSMSGVNAKTKDSFGIQRQTLNDVDTLRTELLHGGWRSLDDNSDVYIWADAHDSGLDKFAVECFIVRGCNIPSVVLVGRDNDEEAWHEIEVLDLKRYSLPGIEYVDTTDGRTAVGGFDFSNGKFGLGRYYFKPNGQRAALVKRAAGNSVALSINDAAIYPDEGQIFSSKGYKMLDQQTSYRYVGLKLEAYSTYEGYFTLENFDFGLLRSVPLEYNHSTGTGLKIELSPEIYIVHDENNFYFSNRPQKSFEFTYSITDSKTLMRMVSTIDKVSMNRRPVWVIDGTDSSLENISLCLVDSVSAIEPLVEEDGDSYYKFSITLRSLDGE